MCKKILPFIISENERQGRPETCINKESASCF